MGRRVSADEVVEAIKALPGNKYHGRIATQYKQPLLNQGGQTINGPKKCGKCKICDITLEITQFQHHGTTYPLKNKTSCGSSFVIYCIQCPRSLIYIGKTTHPFRVRMNEHRSRLHCKRIEAPLVPHCLEHSHKFEELHCFCLEQINVGFDGKSKDQTLIREQRWIYNLQSVIPTGLNAQIDWSVCV